MNWIKVWGLAFLIAILIATATLLYSHFHTPDVRQGDVWSTTLYKDSQFEKSIDMYVVKTDEYYVEYAYFPLRDTTHLWVTTKKEFNRYKLISRKTK